MTANEKMRCEFWISRKLRDQFDKKWHELGFDNRKEAMHSAIRMFIRNGKKEGENP